MEELFEFSGPYYDNGAELGKREMAGRVMVEKEVVKEALAELLNEIPAFKALVLGEGLPLTRQSGT